MRMRISFALIGVALILNVTQAMAEHLPGERHIFRTLCAVAGTIGGVAIGGLIGDTGGKNYSRNVTTGVVVGGIGGGVGGFFLGRMIDKGRARSHQNNLQRQRLDHQKISEAQARAMDVVANEFAARFRKPVSEPTSGK